MVSDSAIYPPPFQGTSKENTEEWLAYFIRYADFKGFQDDQRRSLFAVLLRGSANTWFNGIHDSDKMDFDTLKDQFATKYAPAPTSQWRRASEMSTRDQRREESVEEYWTHMMRKARDACAAEEMTRFDIMRGLRPQ